MVVYIIYINDARSSKYQRFKYTNINLLRTETTRYKVNTWNRIRHHSSTSNVAYH